VILVDSSVWIQHLRVGLPRLVATLNSGLVVMHPFVIGELACGTLKDRELILRDLDQLPQVEAVEHAEVITLVERWKLAGSGIGWIDAHLLAAALIAGAELWTLDQTLQGAWQRLSAAS